MEKRMPGGGDLSQLSQLSLQDIPIKAVGAGGLALLGVLLVWSSVFTVGPEEVGVVQTFGKYSHQAEPGLRIKWPRPIQTVIKVPVQRQLKAEFGFRTERAGLPTTSITASAPRPCVASRRISTGWSDSKLIARAPNRSA